jgi:hypothetical protein
MCRIVLPSTTLSGSQKGHGHRNLAAAAQAAVVSASSADSHDQTLGSHTLQRAC